MSDSAEIPASAPALVGSERFRLAWLAPEAARRLPRVLGTDAVPMGTFITVGKGERLESVSLHVAELATDGEQ